MKKFLIVVLLTCLAVTSPTSGMNNKVKKFFKNSFYKIKNAYTKMPETKKQLSKRLALGTATGFGVWKIDSLHAHMHENTQDNNAIEEQINSDASDEQKIFLEVIAHQPYAIPVELLQKLKNNPELARKVILFYFAHKKQCIISDSPITIANEWEQLLSQYTLEELYEIKDFSYFLAQGIDQKKPHEALKYIDIHEKQVRDNKQKQTQHRNLKKKATDELSIECRTIALQHGITIPDWIHFKRGLGFFSNSYHNEIIIGKNDDNTFGFSLKPILGTDGIVHLKDEEVAGFLGHELGHIALAHICFRNQKNEEIAADRYACFRSNKACLGNIKTFTTLMDLYQSKLKNDGLTDEEINKQLETWGEFDDAYPPLKERIKKMQKIMLEKEQTKRGLCKNPFYKQLGSNKWFECKKQDKFSQNTLKITKNY